MMIDLPSYGPTSRVRLGSFLRSRPLLLNYTGDKTLSNFQVKCVLTSHDISFEKLRADKQDLLFINNNNELIPYWIEKANSTEIIVWLKFSRIIPGGEVFWLYYGNGNFSGASSGEEVFEFFDNFENYAIGAFPNKWLDYGLHGGKEKMIIDNTYVFHGSQSLKTNAGGANNGVQLVKKLSINKSLSLDVWIREPMNKIAFKLAVNATDNGYWGDEYFMIRDESNYYYVRYKSANYAETNEATSVARKPSGTWVNFQIVFMPPSKVIAYIDGTKVKEISDLFTSTPTDIALLDWWGTTADNLWDLVRVRKYTDIEPIILK